VKNELSELLQATDPVTRESGLSRTETETMRRTIVAAERERRRVWASLHPAVLTMVVALTLVVSVLLGPLLQRVTRESAPSQASDQRQLQFETPGGTRVVWVLNSQFDFSKDR
jgi:hypothetical protein